MRISSFTSLSTAAVVLACPPESSTQPPLEPLALRHAEAIADNTVAIEWNRIAYETANAHDQFLSFLGVRALAMTHIAMHDALNAIAPRYAPYAFKGRADDANVNAAAIQAAYAVLAATYPKQLSTLDAVRTQWLDAIPNAEGKARGIALGDRAAAAILARRNGDGHDAIGDYKPGTQPGKYRFTPPFDFSLAPDFRHAQPFALNVPNQFRSAPPPALGTAAYASSFNEVKRLGGGNSTARTQDETNYAHWWAEFAEHSFNRIGRLTAAERKLDLWATARMFALINMDIYDVYLAAWDSKYHYNTWRPVTAIHAADLDGNPKTEPDADWTPEMQTLPFPEYPSAHAAVCAGGAEVISHVYGTARVAFRMQSLTALPGAETRAFENVRAAADECADSRVMNGFHFRFATEAGKALGRNVARHLIATTLRPM